MYQEILPKKATKLQIREAIAPGINDIINGILFIKDTLDDVRTPLGNDIDETMDKIRERMTVVMQDLE